MQEDQQELGLVIDLTFTTRYYGPQVSPFYSLTFSRKPGNFAWELRGGGNFHPDVELRLVGMYIIHYWQQRFGLDFPFYNWCVISNQMWVPSNPIWGCF